MQRVFSVFFFVVAMSLSQLLFADVVYHLSISIDQNLDSSMALVNLFPGNSSVNVLSPDSGRSEVFTVQQRSSLGRKLALSPSAASRLGLAEGSVAEVRLVNLSFSGRNPEVSPAAEYQDIVAGPLGAERSRIQIENPSSTSVESNAVRPTAPAPSIVVPPAATSAPTSTPSRASRATNRTASPLPETPYLGANSDGLPPNPRPKEAPAKNDDSLLIATEEERLRIPLPDDSLGIDTSNALPSNGKFEGLNRGTQAPSARISRGGSPNVVYPSATPNVERKSEPTTLAQNIPRGPKEPRQRTNETVQASGDPRLLKERVEKTEVSPESRADETIRLSGDILRPNTERLTERLTEKLEPSKKAKKSEGEIYFPKVSTMNPPPTVDKRDKLPSDERIPGYDDISPSNPSSMIVANEWYYPENGGAEQEDSEAESDGAKEGMRAEDQREERAKKTGSAGNDWGERSQGGSGGLTYGVQKVKPNLESLRKPTDTTSLAKQVDGVSKARRQEVHVIGKMNTLDLPRGYYIQLVSFLDVRKTRAVYHQFVNEYKMNVIPARVNGKKYYRCLIGSLEESEVADILRKVRSFGYTDAFVYKNF